MGREVKTCAAILAIFGAVVLLSPTAEGLGTVYDIDVDLYVGRWYQVYTNFWADFFAEIEGGECTTATYGKISDTNVTVTNAYITKGGQPDVLTGYAWIPLIQEPGKLLVKLEGVPLAAPYWIIKLGPIVNGQYEYSIVTDSRAFSLFVLVRDVETFDRNYDAEVREYLMLTGFTTPPTMPVRVYHGSDCPYPEMPES